MVPLPPHCRCCSQGWRLGSWFLWPVQCHGPLWPHGPVQPGQGCVGMALREFMESCWRLCDSLTRHRGAVWPHSPGMSGQPGWSCVGMALKVLLGSCPPKQESTSHRAAPSPGWDTASPLQDQVHLLRVCRQWQAECCSWHTWSMGNHPEGPERALKVPLWGSIRPSTRSCTWTGASPCIKLQKAVVSAWLTSVISKIRLKEYFNKILHLVE